MDELVRRLDALAVDDRHNIHRAIRLALHDASKAIADLRTRPTADLGEDGELIAALWSYAHDLKVAVPLRQAMEDARDRLIVYREALVKARPFIEAHFECLERTEALAAIDALLSRSGDD